jgi:hypothetical protein
MGVCSDLSFLDGCFWVREQTKALLGTWGLIETFLCLQVFFAVAIDIKMRRTGSSATRSIKYILHERRKVPRASVQTQPMRATKAASMSLFGDSFRSPTSIECSAWSCIYTFNTKETANSVRCWKHGSQQSLRNSSETETNPKLMSWCKFTPLFVLCIK